MTRYGFFSFSILRISGVVVRDGGGGNREMLFNRYKVIQDRISFRDLLYNM